MRIKLVVIFISVAALCHGQSENRISTVDFVQILNSNTAEAIYYYQNNWKALRTKALAKGYIESFQLLETQASEEAPFQLILITTYPNKVQYESREQNFAELIKERGEQKLMNEKKPTEFRKILFSKEMVNHL